jgi:drug/metabolite transporter (DMT)-like permease
MKGNERKAMLYAILAAVLYALSAPCSKLLLRDVSETMMAAFQYLGAGLGMLMIGFTGTLQDKNSKKGRISKTELCSAAAMIILDILAPIFLMLGLARTPAENVSLLNNFEIVATSLTAWLLFRETIRKRLWISITLVTLSSILLTFHIGSFSFRIGSAFVLLACICWGFENNCTRMLSLRNPLYIVVVKGICSGTGSFLIALTIGNRIPQIKYMILTLLLGCVAYGLSIYYYVRAQRYIGAAKTSTYYAIAPFVGVLLSMVIFRQFPGVNFIAAVIIMLLGTYFAATDHPDCSQ